MIYDLMIAQMDKKDATINVFSTEYRTATDPEYQERTAMARCDQQTDHSTHACRFTYSPSFSRLRRAGSRFAMSYRANLFDLAMTCRGLYHEIIPTMYAHSKLTIWTEPSAWFALSGFLKGGEEWIRRFPGCATVQTLNIRLNDNFGPREAREIKRLVRTYFFNLRELYLTMPLLWVGLLSPYYNYGKRSLTLPRMMKNIDAGVKTLGWHLPGRVNIRIDNSEGEKHWSQQWGRFLFKLQNCCDDQTRKLEEQRRSRRRHEARWAEASRRSNRRGARMHEIDVLAQTLETTLSLRTPET